MENAGPCRSRPATFARSATNARASSGAGLSPAASALDIAADTRRASGSRLWLLASHAITLNPVSDTAVHRVRDTHRDDWRNVRRDCEVDLDSALFVFALVVIYQRSFQELIEELAQPLVLR